MKRLGRIIWNIMAVVGIVTITGIVLSVAGLVALIND